MKLLILSISLLISASHVLAQGAGNSPAQPAPGSRTTASTPAQKQTGNEDGQQVFQRNCSRCHHEPEGFPPAVSGTVARHMRVRANLSEKQYKALLSFLNP